MTLESFQKKFDSVIIIMQYQVDGKQRMWWPTQYVLVTLEETRRIVRDRFPVADLLKCVPEKGKVGIISQNFF